MQNHIDSYYSATTKYFQKSSALEHDLRCDVCVIGGGFTGVSAALHLAEMGYQVVLLEANRIGWGASGRNGGQLHTGQRKWQSELEELFGLEQAKALWDLAEEAKALVKQRISQHEIQCDYKDGLLHAAHKPAYVDEYRQEAELLQSRYDYQHIRFVDRDEISQMLGTDIYYGGSLDQAAGHLHPLNYVQGLAQAAKEAGVKIFEGSSVQSFTETEPVHIKTQLATVSADFAVVACNGYLERLNRSLASLIMPINNFIIATQPLGDSLAKQLIRDDVAVADSKFVVDYYRLSQDKRLLFGGGENYSSKFPRDIANFVRPAMLKVYPQLAQTKIDYAWGGTLAITLNRLPSFGRLQKNVFYAQGFSGQGVCLTTLAGKLIAEAVSGTAQRFDIMAQLPTPKFPGGTLLRYPGLVAGMLYYSLKDKF